MIWGNVKQEEIEILTSFPRAINTFKTNERSEIKICVSHWKEIPIRQQRKMLAYYFTSRNPDIPNWIFRKTSEPKNERKQRKAQRNFFSLINFHESTNPSDKSQQCNPSSRQDGLTNFVLFFLEKAKLVTRSEVSCKWVEQTEKLSLCCVVEINFDGKRRLWDVQNAITKTSQNNKTFFTL